MSSRTAMSTQKNPISKKPKNQSKNKQTKPTPKHLSFGWFFYILGCRTSSTFFSKLLIFWFCNDQYWECVYRKAEICWGPLQKYLLSPRALELFTSIWQIKLFISPLLISHSILRGRMDENLARDRKLISFMTGNRPHLPTVSIISNSLKSSASY